MSTNRRSLSTSDHSEDRWASAKFQRECGRRFRLWGFRRSPRQPATEDKAIAFFALQQAGDLLAVFEGDANGAIFFIHRVRRIENRIQKVAPAESRPDRSEVRSENAALIPESMANRAPALVES